MYTGFFINLDRNENRRDALVRHLEEIGAASRYERYPAINGRAVAANYATTLDAGALGLWLTHEKILQSRMTSDTHIHIIEDDALMARDAVNLFDLTLRQASAQLPSWDIIFTDVFVPLSSEVFHQFAEKMKLYAALKSHSLIDLTRISFACTSSMFINKASVPKYMGLLAGKWSQGLPIDIYIRHLAQRGMLRCFVTMPFMTTVSRESLVSDIRGSVDRSRTICEILRRSFFREADLDALLAEMRELTKDAKISTLASIFMEALSFTASDQWVGF